MDMVIRYTAQAMDASVGELRNHKTIEVPIINMLFFAYFGLRCVVVGVAAYASWTFKLRHIVVFELQVGMIGSLTRDSANSELDTHGILYRLRRCNVA